MSIENVTVYELDLLEEHDNDEEGGDPVVEKRVSDLKSDTKDLTKKLSSQDDVVEQLVFCKYVGACVFV